MKVICIRGAKLGEITKLGLPILPHQVINEGKEYIVTDERVMFGVLGYHLAGIDDLWYQASRFIPTSDNDETERIDEILETMFVPQTNQHERSTRNHM